MLEEATYGRCHSLWMQDLRQSTDDLTGIVKRNLSLEPARGVYFCSAENSETE